MPEKFSRSVCMSYWSDDISMERRNFYLFMGDEKIWKTVPFYKEKRNKEIKLRGEDRSEKAVKGVQCTMYEIYSPLRLHVRFSLVDFIMKRIVKYQAAMPAICHWSHVKRRCLQYVTGHISSGDDCNMSLFTYQAAMPAICHWSHIKRR